ncbi:SO_0444 family Cu/Zn efflux transporter [Guyparkeria hydrothermalis]|uniref:SO_0444 family Cu/Zn efflux transporter n=1 Tax=Guyparkeria TaxID=2035712 RepID=UPI0010AD5A70|nr:MULTISPECIES: SO_0444 family Cu/Zn efflux transporter [Guyparkeria]MCL7750961.1 SO_0444 family Cu/Zn efflux transporter [Guyparkeria hydrothermalis]TKA88669.1 permease [Guyparkeria sp. SB14A]
MTQWFNELWFLTLEAAPWLLLGLVIAALIKAFSDQLAIAKYLSGESTGAITRAAFIGAPLPLCSCGVVPAVLGLKDAGAGRGPSMAFLVATPETGPDSISVSYGMLGPVYAIARPIAAILGAIVTGVVSGRLAGPAPDHAATTSPSAAVDGCCSEERDSGCCGGETNPTAASCCDSTPSITGHCDSDEAASGASCCGNGEATSRTDQPSARDRLSGGFAYAFGQVLIDIVPWMVFGLAVAATAVVLIPDGFFDNAWGLVGSYLLMAVIGIPMYVCATASTPIAAGLLVAGMSPGAALVFLLAGPATNIGTLGILRKHFGNRLITLYLVTVIACALVAGIALDLLWRAFDWSLPSGAAAGHAMEANAIGIASLAVLTAVTIHAYWRRRRARSAPSQGSGQASGEEACGCASERDGSR